MFRLFPHTIVVGPEIFTFFLILKQAKFNLKLMQRCKLPISLILHLSRIKKIKNLQRFISF